MFRMLTLPHNIYHFIFECSFLSCVIYSDLCFVASPDSDALRIITSSLLCSLRPIVFFLLLKPARSHFAAFATFTPLRQNAEFSLPPSVPSNPHHEEIAASDACPRVNVRFLNPRVHVGLVCFLQPETLVIKLLQIVCTV